MVYGLYIRPEWGFDPKRNWEGDDQPARRIPALNPANDGGVSGDSHLAGLPVDGTNFPKWVKWTDPNGNPVPDFDSIPFMNVSEKAKTAIEKLEPGVHQFFPVEFQDGKGNSVGTRYWFVPCNRLDSIDRDHVNMVLLNGWEWRPHQDLVRRGKPIPDHIDLGKPSNYVFNLSSIGDRHIWRDKHISTSVWISEKMMALFKTECLNGIRYPETGMETV